MPAVPALQPVDRNGRPVKVGDRVRLVALSGQWLDDLPDDEKGDVMSMIGDVFAVDEFDEYGHAWISRSWSDETAGLYRAHSIALARHEMELVETEPVDQGAAGIEGR